MEKIQMVDLTTQYACIQKEMDNAILQAVRSGQYINGTNVTTFCNHLAQYTGAEYAIPCANGTDALQISLMALKLKPGDEVIIPSFTYAAAAEAAILLGLVPVFVDVDPDTFNIDTNRLEEAMTAQTKAIIPVHLFGQTCDMGPLLKIAEKYNLYIVEDNAQSIGSVYTFPDGSKKHAGTIGDTGILSFFPTKNLGCYGDGGAILTSDPDLAQRLRMITTHGQSKKYHHSIIGCNSRLDTLQAAILDVKLKYLDQYINARRKAAAYYKEGLSPSKDFIRLPQEASYSTHVFNQFTIQVKNGKRDELCNFLREREIPTIIYYPIPLQQQEAFKNVIRLSRKPVVANQICNSVVSLPMHTELKQEQLDYIIENINQFFN